MGPVLYVLLLWPTVLLYGFLLWSIRHYLRNHESVYLFIALAPFAWWAYAVTTGTYMKAQVEREHASITTVPPPRELPDTIVFEGSTHFPKPADVHRSSAFRYAIYSRFSKLRSTVPHSILKYDLAAPALKPVALQQLPDRYIVVRTGNRTPYQRDGGGIKDIAAGPFEMRHIDGRRDDLIAVYFRRFIPVPTFPPVLTPAGWGGDSNTITSGESERTTLEFMSSSLRRR